MESNRSRWHLPFGLTALGVMGLLMGFTAAASSLASAATNPARTPIHRSSVGNCGNAAPLGIGGSWTCSFDDEFSGANLDTAKWLPQQTSNSGFTSGLTACFVNNPNNISVSGGYLHLTALHAPAPFTCNDPFGNFTTQETSGMVSTYNLFSQTYGAFEVRAKVPASTIAGLQETFWLFPQSLSGYGAWPNSGEIDFAEFYSEYPALDVPYIHYNQAGYDPNVTAYNCTIVPGTFNTYDVEWSPGIINVLFNGHVCLTDHPTPAFPLSSPQPFDKPFFIALTQALGFYTNNYNPGVTPLPATTLVDYVRAWKPTS